tara:strand:- start:223 stop:672 length:450 start_codon:yes stop_codon:yes gene_type:complete
MKKIFITFLFILLTSCDYTPIYSTENSKFKLNQIEVDGNKKINKLILRKIYRLQETESNLIYDLDIISSEQINSISKDSKGNTTVLEMIISTNINVKKNNFIIKKYNFSENFTYKNNSNLFELKQYEKDIQNKMIEKIVENLILNLGTI